MNGLLERQSLQRTFAIGLSEYAFSMLEMRGFVFIPKAPYLRFHTYSMGPLFFDDVIVRQMVKVLRMLADQPVDSTDFRRTQKAPSLQQMP